MHLIVGLGNPGEEHRYQRHNIGFMAADAIARQHGFPPFKSKFKALISDGTIDGQRVLLLKPQTYMNRSGDAVGAAAKFYKIAPEDITILYDELDLIPGKVRVKVNGGNGGHNGLRSIDPVIGTAYRRVRLGIGHPGHKDLVTRHVLGNFARSDTEWLEPLLDAIGENAGLLPKGDEANFMNKLALALNDDPPPAKQKSGGKGRSHIRQARTKTPAAKVPTSGPMAAMLKKLFKKD